MFLQTTTVDRQWLGIDHVVTSAYTNGTVSMQRREDVFYSVRAEMLQSGPVACLVRKMLRFSLRELVVEAEDNCGIKGSGTSMLKSLPSNG
jgi:hypothetical protein